MEKYSLKTDPAFVCHFCKCGSCDLQQPFYKSINSRHFLKYRIRFLVVFKWKIIDQQYPFIACRPRILRSSFSSTVRFRKTKVVPVLTSVQYFFRSQNVQISSELWPLFISLSICSFQVGLVYYLVSFTYSKALTIRVIRVFAAAAEYWSCREPPPGQAYMWPASYWRQLLGAEEAKSLHFPWALSQESTSDHVDTSSDISYIYNNAKRQSFDKY